jgi:hypothetical protein
VILLFFLLFYSSLLNKNNIKIYLKNKEHVNKIIMKVKSNYFHFSLNFTLFIKFFEIYFFNFISKNINYIKK